MRGYRPLASAPDTWVIQAEKYTALVPNSGGTHGFAPSTEVAGFTGLNYMADAPDVVAFVGSHTTIGNFTHAGGALEYLINVETADTHYLYLRGLEGTIGQSNRMNARWLHDASGMLGIGSGAATWGDWMPINTTAGSSALGVDLEPGLYKLQVSPRQGGVGLDALIITTDAAFAPDGGPGDALLTQHSAIDREGLYSDAWSMPITDLRHDAQSAEFIGAPPAGYSINGATLEYDGSRTDPATVQLNIRVWDAAGLTGTSTDVDPFLDYLHLATPAVIDYSGITINPASGAELYSANWATDPAGSLKVDGGIDGVRASTFELVASPAGWSVTVEAGGVVNYSYPITTDPATYPIELRYWDGAALIAVTKNVVVVDTSVPEWDVDPAVTDLNGGITVSATGNDAQSPTLDYYLAVATVGDDPSAGDIVANTGVLSRIGPTTSPVGDAVILALPLAAGTYQTFMVSTDGVNSTKYPLGEQTVINAGDTTDPIFTTGLPAAISADTGVAPVFPAVVVDEPVTFTATLNGSALPGGWTLDASTGQITAPVLADGTYTVVLTATDAAANTSTTTTVITVAAVVIPPAITPPASEVVIPTDEAARDFQSSSATTLAGELIPVFSEIDGSHTGHARVVLIHDPAAEGTHKFVVTSITTPSDETEIG